MCQGSFALFNHCNTSKNDVIQTNQQCVSQNLFRHEAEAASFPIPSIHVAMAFLYILRPMEVFKAQRISLAPFSKTTVCTQIKQALLKHYLIAFPLSGLAEA